MTIRTVRPSRRTKGRNMNKKNLIAIIITIIGLSIVLIIIPTLPTRDFNRI